MLVEKIEEGVKEKLKVAYRGHKDSRRFEGVSREWACAVRDYLVPDRESIPVEIRDKLRRKLD